MMDSETSATVAPLVVWPSTILSWLPGAVVREQGVRTDQSMEMGGGDFSCIWRRQMQCR